MDEVKQLQGPEEEEPAWLSSSSSNTKEGVPTRASTPDYVAKIFETLLRYSVSPAELLKIVAPLSSDFQWPQGICSEQVQKRHCAYVRGLLLHLLLEAARGDGSHQTRVLLKDCAEVRLPPLLDVPSAGYTFVVLLRFDRPPSLGCSAPRGAATDSTAVGSSGPSSSAGGTRHSTR